MWEKEEQRNGRGLSAASGGQDEGCGVCSDANPPLPFSFYRQRLFLCRAKKKGLNTALSEAFRKKLRHSGAKKSPLRVQRAKTQESKKNTAALAHERVAAAEREAQAERFLCGVRDQEAQQAASLVVAVDAGAGLGRRQGLMIAAVEAVVKELRQML